MSHQLVQQIKALAAQLPPARLAFEIAPGEAVGSASWETAAAAGLRTPIGTSPLRELARGRRRVVVLADDLTRPTPQAHILPVLLDELNAAGVPDDAVTVLIALGTHRYMTDAEIRSRFGDAVCRRVRVVNHLWQDPDTFVDLGSTKRHTPISVNRVACESDLLIATGSIVPHIYAGWAGGAKAVQPGVCSAATTARTHCMAAEEPDLLGIAGTEENPIRHEMEEVAERVGLDFILNVVCDAAGGPAWAGAGHFVKTHRMGVRAAREVLVRPVPKPADVVIADAEPATVDYWQGIKALAHAVRGVKPGGTVILVGDFPEGIAPTHPEFAHHALRSYGDLVRDCAEGAVHDRIASATLRLHALIRERCRVTCVSPGMNDADKALLGFEPAESVEDALDAALARHGADASVGIIHHGGDVLPEIAGTT